MANIREQGVVVAAANWGMNVLKDIIFKKKIRAAGGWEENQPKGPKATPWQSLSNAVCTGGKDVEPKP